MTNKNIFIATSLACAALLASPLQAEELTGNINFLIGQKTLDSDWEFGDNTETQGTVALDFDIAGESWPVAINIAYFLSEEKVQITSGIFTNDYDVTTSELRLGVKKIWQTNSLGGIKPYIGGGIANISGEFDPGDSDSSSGYYLTGGAYWTFTSGFNIGLDLGISSGDVEIQGGEVDAGGTHTNLILGYQF